MKNLAVIPARAGSSRIPDKNVRPLLGRPMLGWPLAAAAHSGLFETIHVSTDSEAYARAAGDLGFPVAFLRPAELSGNEASLMDLLRWIVGRFDAAGRRFDTVALIYATAVLIEPDDLRAGYALLCRDPAAPPVLTVGKAPGPVERALRIDADGVLRWIEPANRTLHSQQCRPAYFDAAGFALFTREHLLARPQSMVEDFRALILPPVKLCDINEPEDLDLARTLLLGRRADAALS